MLRFVELQDSGNGYVHSSGWSGQSTHIPVNHWTFNGSKNLTIHCSDQRNFPFSPEVMFVACTSS
jgi:hypothetical protein